jgi:hypothetical protein
MASLASLFQSKLGITLNRVNKIGTPVTSGSAFMVSNGG